MVATRQLFFKKERGGGGRSHPPLGSVHLRLRTTVVIRSALENAKRVLQHDSHISPPDYAKGRTGLG